MINDAPATATADLTSASEVERFVRGVADTVYDPCGMAMGLQIGLAEMGLVRLVEIDEVAGGWRVAVHLRLTSPGCQYFYYFQQELEARLLGQTAIHEATVHWDERLDWTPADMAGSAQAKIAKRQALLHLPPHVGRRQNSNSSETPPAENVQEAANSHGD